jgi:hypothetical protein
MAHEFLPTYNFGSYSPEPPEDIQVIYKAVAVVGSNRVSFTRNKVYQVEYPIRHIVHAPAHLGTSYYRIEPKFGLFGFESFKNALDFIYQYRGNRETHRIEIWLALTKGPVTYVTVSNFPHGTIHVPELMLWKRLVLLEAGLEALDYNWQPVIGDRKELKQIYHQKEE